MTINDDLKLSFLCEREWFGGFLEKKASFDSFRVTLKTRKASRLGPRGEKKGGSYVLDHGPFTAMICNRRLYDDLDTNFMQALCRMR